MSWLIRVPDAAGIPIVVGVTVVNNSTNASFTVPLPAGWQANDLFVLYTMQIGNNAFTTVSAGWSLYTTQLTTGSDRTSVHTRIAQSGDTAPTVTFPSSNPRIIYLAAYRKSGGTPTLSQFSYLTDFSSPYATTSIATTQPSLVSLATAASASTGTAVSITVSISDATDTIYRVTNRAVALTHFDGTNPGTFGPYNLTYSTTVSSAGARSILLEIR